MNMPVRSEHDPPHNSEAIEHTDVERQMEELLLGNDPLADLTGPFAPAIQAWHSKLTKAAKEALSANDLLCLNGIITSSLPETPK